VAGRRALPMPGTLRIGSASMKAATASASAGSTNWPSGLLMSDAILASRRLGATPQLHVTRTSSRTRRRSSSATWPPARHRPHA
jgi:hypothetical protein